VEEDRNVHSMPIKAMQIETGFFIERALTFYLSLFC